MTTNKPEKNKLEAKGIYSTTWPDGRVLIYKQKEVKKALEEAKKLERKENY